MSIKVLVMVKRKPGLTPEEFREGYEQSHSRIAVNLFGHLWTSYRRDYLIGGRRFEEGEGGWTGGPDDFHYDAISEYILPDGEAMAEFARIGEENIGLLKEDEALWFDQPNCWMVSCDSVEEDLTAPRPPLRRWAGPIL